MAYIIINTNTKGLGSYIERYYWDYKAKDCLTPIKREYGDRIVARNPLTFETLERATTYIKNNCTGNGFKVVPYNTCTCQIEF